VPIATVELTDTFDQWRQKTNSMIGVVNSLTASGAVLSVNNAVANQLLICDGSVFKNVTVYGDVTFASDGRATIVGGPGSQTKGRIRFAGSMKSLF
jgi:hypothetical protein